MMHFKRAGIGQRGTWCSGVGGLKVESWMGKTATLVLPLGSRQVSRFPTAGTHVAGLKSRHFWCVTTTKEKAASSW